MPFCRECSGAQGRDETLCLLTDEDVFSGMALLEESPVTQLKEATAESAQLTQANFAVK